MMSRGFCRYTRRQYTSGWRAGNFLACGSGTDYDSSPQTSLGGWPPVKEVGEDAQAPTRDVQEGRRLLLQAEASGTPDVVQSRDGLRARVPEASSAKARRLRPDSDGHRGASCEALDRVVLGYE